MRSFLLVPVFALATALSSGAQSASVPADFRFVVDTNPYLTSSNPATIGLFSLGKLSIVEMSGTKSDGGLKSLEESSDSYDAGVSTESFVKISNKIAFSGKLSYSYFSGRNMGGQILMDPAYNPVNFLESTETNLGTKTRELYRLAGGMSYTFNDKWSAGVKADYESGDMSKTKDPRFQNVWMDLNISAGVNFKVSEAFDAGLSLKYRNTLENLSAGIFGTTDEQYYVYTDKGGFYGAMEMLAGDLAYISTSSVRPMSNWFLGGELQASLGIGGARLFNELSFLYRDGYYGEKASSSPVYFEFSGFEASYQGRLLLPMGHNLHSISLSAAYKPLTNYENNYKYNTPAGGSTVVEYYGQNKLLERTDISAAIGYVFYQDVRGSRPKGEYGLDADFNMRSQTTTIYPFYRNHDASAVLVTARGLRNFSFGASILSLGADLRFHTGFGTAAQDGSYSESSSTTMKSFDGYLYKHFEYETSTYAGAGLRLGYTRVFSGKYAFSVLLRDNFASMLAKPEYLADGWRNVATLTIGCTF